MNPTLSAIALIRSDTRFCRIFNPKPNPKCPRRPCIFKVLGIADQQHVSHSLFLVFSVGSTNLHRNRTRVGSRHVPSEKITNVGSSHPVDRRTRVKNARRQSTYGAEMPVFDANNRFRPIARPRKVFILQAPWSRCVPASKRSMLRATDSKGLNLTGRGGARVRNFYIRGMIFGSRCQG